MTDDLDDAAVARLRGILVQTRADLPGESPAVVEQALRRRLDDAGFALDDAEVARLVAELR